MKLGILLLLSTCFLLSEGQDDSRPLTGALSIAENYHRLEICGTEISGPSIRGFYTEDDAPMVYAISPRHIIADMNNPIVGAQYEKSACQNNMIPFVWLDEDQLGYYIGSCEFDHPDGFVVMEFNTPYPVKLAPFCLPNRPPKDGDKVAALTNAKYEDYRQSISTQIKTCDEQHSNEKCIEKLENGYIGPVVDLSEEREVYVALAHRNDSEHTFIVPIYQYLDVLCAATGICPPTPLEEKMLAEAASDARETTHDQYEASSEIESSGNNGITSGSEKLEEESDAVPAKVFAASLIPLPVVQDNTKSQLAQYLQVSASFEVLIAGVLLLALVFYAVVLISVWHNRRQEAARVD